MFLHVSRCPARGASNTSHRLAGEYENPAKWHGVRNLPKMRTQAARATEFHEDRRTATMNISPGPRIIIRNEIALESLINRRAADAVALKIRGLQVPKATTAIFRTANHRPSQYYLLKNISEHIIEKIYQFAKLISIYDWCFQNNC